jgi:hypothetical protein
VVAQNSIGMLIDDTVFDLKVSKRKFQPSYKFNLNICIPKYVASENGQNNYVNLILRDSSFLIFFKISKISIIQIMRCYL